MKVDIVYEFRTGGTIYILDLFITERKEGVYIKRLKNTCGKIFREIKRRYRSITLHLFNVFSVIQRNMSRLTRKDQRRGVKVDCINAS